MTECGKLLGDRLEYLFRMDWAQIEKVQRDHEETKKQIAKQAQDLDALNVTQEDLAQKIKALQETQAKDHSDIVNAYNRMRKEFRTYTGHVQDAHNRAYNLSKSFASSLPR